MRNSMARMTVARERSRIPPLDMLIVYGSKRWERRMRKGIEQEREDEEWGR